MRADKIIISKITKKYVYSSGRPTKAYNSKHFPNAEVGQEWQIIFDNEGNVEKAVPWKQGILRKVVKENREPIIAFLVLVGLALIFVIANQLTKRTEPVSGIARAEVSGIARAEATPPIADCLYQDMPVGEMMPIVPECNYRMKVVQWNAYVRIFPTKWEGGMPIGLRWRNVPTLYTPSKEEPRGQAQGTAFTYCLEPEEFGYLCSNVPMYFEKVIYREAIPELGWHDKGYFGWINKFGFYPFCVTLPNRAEVCYTDWTPTPPVIEAVNGWKITR